MPAAFMPGLIYGLTSQPACARACRNRPLRPPPSGPPSFTRPSAHLLMQEILAPLPFNQLRSMEVALPAPGTILDMWILTNRWGGEEGELLPLQQ